MQFFPWWFTVKLPRSDIISKKLDELANFPCYYGISPDKGLMGGYVSTVLTFVMLGR